MSSTFHSGQQLPGWGSDLRRLPSGTRRTALMLATFAGLAISGCSAGVPSTPSASSSTSTTVSAVSGPGRLKGALALAIAHLDAFPLPASNPYHLVGFRGRALDESGATTAVADSTWEFTFSRYADDSAEQRYDVVTVSVPGVGNTAAVRALSTEVGLSPIEGWDAASDGATPDSPDFLAPLKAAGASTQNAIVTLSQGHVRAEAGGKFVMYDVAEGKFGPIQ
jgi:hypothetical protein